MEHRQVPWSNTGFMDGEGLQVKLKTAITAGVQVEGEKSRKEEQNWQIMYHISELFSSETC